jgi:hypothetical protein
MKTDAPELERLEEQIEATGAGEVAGSMSALEETIVFVDLPAHCQETDLPRYQAVLEEVVAGSELAGFAKVEIPEDADDSGNEDE